MLICVCSRSEQMIPEGSWPLYERIGLDAPLVYQLSRQGHRWVAKCGESFVLHSRSARTHVAYNLLHVTCCVLHEVRAER